LLKIVEKVSQMAEAGQGTRPRYLEPVAADPRAWRQYSFSRLTGNLHARMAPAEMDQLDATGSASACLSGTLAEPVALNAPPAPPLDILGLGTLVHAALEEINFVRPGDIGEIVRRLAEQHLSQSDRGREESLAVDMLARFLASPRAQQLAAASEMHRELDFMLAWPPGESQFDGRHLQGVIDCLYRDAAGRWGLVDYKTNRVMAETLAATAAQYEMQMLVYGLAAETILKSPPTELVLCFLRPGLEHHFAWDAAARRRAVELVEQALP
jgi:ATP-dependent exoDNAse (exonuclease V) beta subunit